MSRKIIATIGLAILAVLGAMGVIWLERLEKKRPSVSDRPVIVTTLVPLTILVRNLAGNFADVQSVLPPGAEPHAVTLSPRELIILHRARVVVRLGLGLDSWVLNGVAAVDRQPSVINIGALLGLETNLSNPHIWLSPKRMLVINERLTTALRLALPEYAGIITERGANYSARLLTLDKEYETGLARVAHKEIITLHNAFGYLAADYGLRVVGVIQEVPEGEPTPAQVAKIIGALRQYPNAPLFGERGIQPAILRTIAHDTSRTVQILDPLEIGATGAEQYEITMRQNLRVLQETLQ